MLYADDATLFIKPIASEVLVTENILEIFAQASGLVTNINKTEFFPIRCEGVSLDFLAQHNRNVASFPCIYLGLPLHFRKPTRAMLHLVIEKIGNRLPGWKKNFLIYPGRELLVKTVLSAMPTYFLTVFTMPKWGLSCIDRFRRNFLRKGKNYENIRGGHCLVNWQTCLRPKELGGLGIKDLEIFSRALCLRWLWHAWDQQDRPWKSLLKVSDPLDMQLFFCSTTVLVGDGKNTPFWKARWLDGTTPKKMASSLYKIARYKSRSVSTELKIARYKSRSVSTELKNHNCIRGLGSIDSEPQIEEFILLFMAIALVQLTDQKDRILWIWTPDSIYSVSSTYEVQFRGSFAPFPAKSIWKAKAELKVRFFGWLVLHNKIMTVNNMLKRNWVCNYNCSLCFCIHETVDHLLAHCNYTDVVWNLIAPSFGPTNHNFMAHQGGARQWMNIIMRTEKKELNLRILFIFWWNI
jgi:hypothetical protein